MAGKPTKKPAKRKPAAKRPNGRPTKKCDKVVKAICDQLSEGIPLTHICRDAAMPHPSTVRDWMDSDAEVSRLIARARELGHDAIAAGTLEIADDSRNDWLDAKAAEGDEKAKDALENGENVQRAKLRIWTRLQLLEKWDRRYNPRQVVEHDVSDNLADQMKAARERASRR